MSGPPKIRDFRPFIICTPHNYEATRSFYTDVGFEKLWDDGSSACEYATGFGSQRFLVTLHYDLQPTTNAMLHFWVDDAEDWYDYLQGLDLQRRHPAVVVTPPVLTEWGWRVTYVADPAGVKLHFAEPYSDDNRAFFREAPWMNE